MAKTISNEITQEYQEALKAHDKENTPESAARLEKAKAAMRKQTESLQSEARENLAKEPKKEPTVEDEYQKVCRELKEGYAKVKELREENKRLHEALNENIRLKKEYNYKILPGLSKKKKALKKKESVK